MKKYITPEIEKIEYEVNEVICNSEPTPTMQKDLEGIDNLIP